MPPLSKKADAARKREKRGAEANAARMREEREEREAERHEASDRLSMNTITNTGSQHADHHFGRAAGARYSSRSWSFLAVL